MILSSQKTIDEYTGNGLWGETTLTEVFRSFAISQPNNDCFVDPPNKNELVHLDPERISYKEADKITDTLATNFIKMGLTKDDIVVIQLPNTVEIALAYLALWKIGVITSPVPMQWREHEIKYVINLTKAKAIISVDEFRGFKHIETFYDIAQSQPTIEHIIPINKLKELSKGEIDEDIINKNQPCANDIATICWTSGTESTPKACPLSHNNWLFQGNILKRSVLLKKGDVILNPAPVVNMTGIGVGYILSIISGGTFILHHPFDPFIYMRQLIEEKVSFSGAVPAMLMMILKNPDIDKFDISHIRIFGTGSAPPAPWVLDEFKKRWNIEIVNIWGQNEGTALIAGPLDVPELEKRVDNFPNWGKKDVVWASKNIGMKAKIIDVDNNTQLVNSGEVGELLFKGPNIIPCYFRQPEHTANGFDDKGFFRTGDLFKISRDNNFLQFFDRKKDIIIRGGQNISAAEVENIVNGHPKVLEAAAVDMPDERLGEKLCIYVVPQPNKTVALEEITSFMKNKGVAIYKLPEYMKIIDAIPRNPVGKILKADLRKDIREWLRQHK